MTFVPATDPTDSFRQRLSKGSNAVLAGHLLDSAMHLLKETVSIESAGVSQDLASSA